MCIHPIHLPSNNLVFQQQDLFLCHDLYICALDIHMLLWHDLKVFCQALWIFVGSLNVQPNNPSTEPIYTAMNRKPKWLLLVISVYMPTEIGPQWDIHSTPQITALPLFHSPRIKFSHWWFNQSSRNINLVSNTQGMPHCSVPIKLSGLVHISCRIMSLTHSLSSSSTISHLVSPKSLSLRLRVRWFILRLWCFSNIKTICLYGRSL